MKNTRLSATSKAAIIAADSIEIVPVENGEGIAHYGVYAWRGGALCACHDGKGMFQLYPTLGDADRAIHRARVGLGSVRITVRAPLTRAAA